MWWCSAPRIFAGSFLLIPPTTTRSAHISLSERTLLWGDPFNPSDPSYQYPCWAASTTNISGWHKRQGQAAEYTWSENAGCQLSVAERPEFRDFLLGHGFALR